MFIMEIQQVYAGMGVHCNGTELEKLAGNTVGGLSSVNTLIRVIVF